VLRSLASTIMLVALYYLLPLDHLADVPLAVILAAGLLALGLGIRAFVGAVQFARQARPGPAGPAAPPELPPQGPGERKCHDSAAESVRA